MPYKNIVFVKVLWKELLHEDDRFLERCNDEQKGLYLMLLLLAGATNNNIKDDAKYLKRTLNLHEKDEKIRENLTVLLQTFSKLISKNGYLKFKNFKKLHNRIGTSQGVPKDVPRDVLDKNRIDKNRIDKNRIDKIMHAFINIKKYPKDDTGLINHLWKRNCRVAKELAGLDADKAVEAMHWFSGICEKKGLNWSLETILKWYPDYLVKGKDFNYDQLKAKFGL